MSKLRNFVCTLTITLSVLGPILVSYYYVALYPVESNSLVLVPSTFSQLPGWNQDDQSKAFAAFRFSCRQIPKQNLGQSWQSVCVTAQHLKSVDTKTARNFFEKWFTPYLITNNRNAQGLFTGYYLPLLHGNLRSTATYTVPIYARPKNLVSVDLGLFRPDLAGTTTIRGEVENGKLLPYPDRAAIVQGKIKNSATVLAWVKNPIKFFFMQIQGSGLIALPHGKEMLLGYADSNGRPYVAIGRVLLKQGALEENNVSMNTITQWLQDHPEQMNTILNSNPSFVFFRIIQAKNPLGSEQVPLTPERSLAVDTRYIALGTPVWLATTLPITSSTPAAGSFQHLLIAQDTGGAIKGIVRGDIYWGAGERAEDIASAMKSEGSYWVLLPKENAVNVIPRLDRGIQAKN